MKNTKWQYLYFDTVESTNDIAIKSVKDTNNDIVVVALEQTSGRGRLGHEWVSEKGNLFFSMATKLKIEISQLAFVVSLSVAEVCRFLGAGDSMGIKWPNDLLFENQKFAGILIEKADNNMVVMGVGINLVKSPESAKICQQATCLKEQNIKINADDFLKLYVERFDYNYDLCQKGFSYIRKNWLGFAKGVGQNIVVRLAKGEKHGVFNGIDEDGFLLLQQKNKIIKIAAGDVFFKD